MPFTTDPTTTMGSLAGKVILITGGTAGLGASTIRTLATHPQPPAHIFFTGRNATAATTLISSIQTTHPNSANLTFLPCDQSRLSTVVSAARQFLAHAPGRLDVLMLNAGIMSDPKLTEDGYEAAFQTNHLAHALWVKMLLPLLRRTAASPPPPTANNNNNNDNNPAAGSGSDVRVVSLASSGYMLAPLGKGIDFVGVKTDMARAGGLLGEAAGKWVRYGQSKLANVLFADELARREGGSGIASVSVHPGYVRTAMTGSESWWTMLPLTIGAAGQWVQPEQGCWNQIWAATAPLGGKETTGLESGGFYFPGGKVAERRRWAGSEKLAGELWEWTERELSGWELGEEVVVKEGQPA